MAQANSSGLRERFHFAGEIPHEDLVHWYRHADVFAYTSLSETFGNVINEALWCGTPVVALDDQMGVSHQVIDGVNGALVGPDRAATDGLYAEACLNLVKDRERLASLGATAATRARETSHPDLIISRFEGIYARAQIRCRELLPTPLRDASRHAQLKAFAFHMSRWAWGHATLLGLAYTASHVGLGRPVLPMAGRLRRS